MTENNIDLGELGAKSQELQGAGRTVVHLAVGGKLVGLIAIADAVRPTAVDAIKALRARGVEVIMLTGDNQGTAQRIAKSLGIDRVFADVLPGDKASKVKELQAQGKRVGMVGDGVNDAPALTQADVGFAIGAGTDVAMESADIVLMKSDPFDVVGAIELSHATLRKMHQNLWWAVGYNVIAFPLAAGVLYPILLGPSIAALAMSGSSAIVAINALMLKRTKLTGIRRQHETAPSLALTPAHGGFMIGRAAPSGVPPSTMVVLMLSVFTVSIGFGVVLPLLPYLIERLLGPSGDAAQVSRATGLLTGLYTLSLFLFAPAWGRMSDRYGRRTILVIGLIGFSATMLIFAFIESLSAVYAERFLSGMFAAAVTPVALAAIGDLAATEEARARRLTFVSLAGISGFLLGPMLGVFIAQGAANMLPIVNASGSLALPLAGTAVLALLVALAAGITVPATKRGDTAQRRDQPASEAAPWLVPKLLSLTFIVSAGVGVFEVGLALHGKQQLGLTQYQIALMFTECSLVMFVVQAIVFSPWVKPETTRWFIAPALTILALGLFLVPRASDFMLMLTVIAAVAASAGILSPILTYWISSKAGRAQGAVLGKHTAAASLGAAMGSAAGGLLFDVAPLPNASFLLMTLLTVLGILLSLGLPSVLVTRKLHEDVRDDQIQKTLPLLGRRSGRFGHR